MPRPPLEVADILRRHAPEYPYAISREQARVLHALQVCRTAHLGGHVERCDSCGHGRNAYNSCRNRHCPKCQALTTARWVAKQTADLLPVSYFHLVFTVPRELVALTLQNQRVLYDILFQATARTLTTIAADPKHLGVEIGFLAVLHTWGQNLQAHPHLHCILPGGGLSNDGQRWISSGKKFFLSVKVLSRLYRRLFLEALLAAYRNGSLEFHGQLQELSKPKIFGRLIRKVRKKEWVVYAKRPFGGPEKVVDYLGRYTHRVAISNHRLLSAKDGQVNFRWKDYRRSKDGAVSWAVMTLDANEFIRRFLLHVLPRGFVRIRRYGLLSNRNGKTKYSRCRELLDAEKPAPLDALDWESLYKKLTGRSIKSCPRCRKGEMQVIEELPSLRSLQEQLDQARLGGYLPGSPLSRCLAGRFLQKIRQLESELKLRRGQLYYAVPPGIDSS